MAPAAILPLTATKIVRVAHTGSCWSRDPGAGGRADRRMLEAVQVRVSYPDKGSSRCGSGDLSRFRPGKAVQFDTLTAAFCPGRAVKHFTAVNRRSRWGSRPRRPTPSHQVPHSFSKSSSPPLRFVLRPCRSMSARGSRPSSRSHAGKGASGSLCSRRNLRRLAEGWSGCRQHGAMISTTSKAPRPTGCPN